MNNTYDIAVIGGGIIGLSTAYYLSKENIRVCVIEKKYIGAGSTGRCIGGIRQQFSTSASIKIMKESLRLFSEMEEEFGFSVDFYQGGYLFLAYDKDYLNTFKKNVNVQKKEGLNVSLVYKDEIKNIVPYLNFEGVLGGAYCPNDAQAYPFYVLKGYSEQFKKNKGDFFIREEVIDIKKEKTFKLKLNTGKIIEAGKVIIAAGPWSRKIGEMLGLNLPLFPERHEALVTERMPKLFEPMIVDYRKDGCYFVQREDGQVIGCYTPHPNVPGIREDASFDFLPSMSWRMSRLVPSLKNSSILRQWAGCYTMTPDGNPITDETEIRDLYVASGMSGHGFMFGPAIGKHFSSFVLNNKWDMDFSEFLISRNFESKESMK